MAIFPKEKKEKLLKDLFWTATKNSRLLFPNATRLSVGWDLACFEVVRYVFDRNSGLPLEVLQK